MAGKRGASSDLNHDNWDQEEEPEQAGTFSQASQDELKTRVIRKAKRRARPPQVRKPEKKKRLFVTESNEPEREC